jgi:hypothetical protein
VESRAAERTIAVGAIPAAHAVTALSAFPALALRSSEATLVSSRYIS